MRRGCDVKQDFKIHTLSSNIDCFQLEAVAGVGALVVEIAALAVVGTVPVAAGAVESAVRLTPEALALVGAAPEVETAASESYTTVPVAAGAVDSYVVRLTPEALALVGALVVEITALVVVGAIPKASGTVESATHAPLCPASRLAERRQSCS